MKKVLCCLAIFISFLFMANVNAEEIQIEIKKAEITPGTYIIGEHMFTREKNEDYDGTLYVEHMLLASKTINSTVLGEMKVYYKNANGIWVNPINNEVIDDTNVPEVFYITYKNVQFIGGLQYGDVNGDSVVDIKDQVDLAQYLSNWDISIIEVAADLNLDGKITNLDSIILSRHIAKWTGYETLPITNVESIITYGDINEDGKINIEDAKLLERAIYQAVKLNSIGQLNADLNKDDILDKTDLIIMLRYINKKEGYTSLPYLEELDEILFGDVNKDGVLTGHDGSDSYFCQKQENYDVDTCLLAHYLAKWEVSIDEEAADVNLDGVVDNKDAVALAQYFAGWAVELPFVAGVHVEYNIIGDINTDGEVDQKDQIALAQYLEGWDVEVNLQAADVNKDGKVNMKDKIILVRHLAGWDDYAELPCKVEFSEVIYGDINADGKVTISDATKLSQYIEDNTSVQLTDLQKLAADLNLDGVIDEKDSEILAQYLSKWEMQLPYLPE